MKTLLITVGYSDPTDKFWWSSYITNKEVSFDPNNETIHDVIKRICEEEGMTLTYKGKPQGNIYRDKKDGSTKTVGYIYRGKGEVHDREMTKPRMVFWDVWAEIEEVIEFEIEQID